MNGKQLKNSILQWAIQGKLVPQDPNDEPASALLERIRKEKARLVKEKKIKKDKNESIIYRGEDNSYYEKILATGKVKCIDDEIPFEIPQGWEWCRLNELGLYRKGPFGSSLTKSMFVPKSDKSIKVYEQKNAIQKDCTLGVYYISQEKFEAMQSFIAAPHDIIVSCAGTIGETYQLPANAPIGIINQALMRVKLYDLRISDYWQLYFEYVLLKNSQMKGAGSAIKNIPPFDYLKALLVPIPPLQEQNRMLAKYMELMKLVTSYQQQSERLDLLNNSIKETLKKSILQEAIQGKLVPQIAEEGTAAELLEQIKAEKKRLVKEGKLKKSALTDSVIYKGNDNKYWENINGRTVDISEDIPFDLPKSWSWVRLGSIVKMSIGKTPPRGETKYWADGKHNWVSISDMNEYGHISKTKEKLSDNAIAMMGNLSPKDTLLMSFKLTVGRTSILDVPAYHNEAIVSMFPLVDKCFELRNYLFYILPVISLFGESKDAIKGKTLNSKSLNSLLCPLPPFAEQKRIVGKIEEIFSKLKGAGLS